MLKMSQMKEPHAFVDTTIEEESTVVMTDDKYEPGSPEFYSSIFISICTLSF